jgi:hypothetical protein
VTEPAIYRVEVYLPQLGNIVASSLDHLKSNYVGGFVGVRRLRFSRAEGDAFFASESAASRGTPSDDLLCDAPRV